MLDQTFALTYCIPGLDYGSIMDMSPIDRRDWLVKLRDQKKAETEAIKKAGRSRK